MKKILSLVLVLAMVLSSFSFAFAAPNDVVDTDYESAVERLMSLGIITGYNDGTYKPDNTITRAEFATIVVRSLGLEGAASGAKGVTVFSDVPATHWASGYINIASRMGYINGMGDGTFAPSANITFEQAVTLVVRALGYEPMAQQKGGYPVGYLVIAAEKEITDGINGTAGFPASRGVVAQLLDASLTVGMLVQDGIVAGQPSYKENKDVTLLSKLGFKNDKYVLIATADVDQDLKANQIVAIDAEGEEKTLTAIDGFNAEALVGRNVGLWFNKAGKVALAENLTKASNVIDVAEIIEFVVDNDEDVKIKIVNADDATKTYTLADEVNVVLNGEVSTYVKAKTVLEDLSDALYDVELVLNSDGKVQFVKALAFNDVFVLASNPIINKVKDIERLRTGMEFKNDDDEVAKLVIMLDGEQVELKDVKKGDLIYVASSLGAEDDITDDKYYIEVVRDTVEGELERVAPSKSAPTSVTVDETKYSISSYAEFKSIDAEIGADVELLLDRDGKVYAIDGVTVSADDYAVVINTAKSEDKYKNDIFEVKLFNEEGKKVEYEIVVEVDDPLYKGDVVSYHLNADGEIDAIEAAAAVAEETSKVTLDVKRDRIGSYYRTKDTLVFNVTELNTDNTADAKVELINWDKLNSKEYTIYGTVVSKGDVAVLALANASVVGDSNYGLVTAKAELSKGFEISLFTDDEEKAYTTVSKDVYANRGQVIEFKLNDSDKMTVATVLEGKVGTIKSVSGNKVKVELEDETVKYFFITDDSAVYYDQDHDGKKVETMQKDELYADMEVTVYDEADGDIIVLVVTEM